MTVRRALAAILLAVCLGAMVAETFDGWDRTARDGNDTEANLVIVVACVSIGFLAAATLLSRVRPQISLRTIVRLPDRFARLVNRDMLAASAASSPPSVLRV